MNATAEKVILAKCESVHVSEQNTRQPTLKQVTASGLLESIQNQGQITPALARPHPTIKDAYELAAGACRHTACTALKTRLKLIVREMDDGELLDAILTENLQRTDPDPEAEADLIALRLAEGLTPEEIAARYGKPPLWIKRRMKILAIIPKLRKSMKSAAGQLGHYSTAMKERLGDLPPATQKNLDTWRLENCTTLAQLNRHIDHLSCSLEGQDWINDPDTAHKGCGPGCATDTSDSLFADAKASCGNCLNSTCFNFRQQLAINKAITSALGDNQITDFILFRSGHSYGRITYKGKELPIADHWRFKDNYKKSRKKTDIRGLDLEDPTKPKISFLTKIKTTSGGGGGQAADKPTREERLTGKRLAFINESVRIAIEKAPIPTTVPILKLVAIFGTDGSRTYGEAWSFAESKSKQVPGLHTYSETPDRTPEQALWEAIQPIIKQRLSYQSNKDLLPNKKQIEMTKAAWLVGFDYKAEWIRICTEEILPPKSWGKGINPITLKTEAAA